jgi:hypothetical protein
MSALAPFQIAIHAAIPDGASALIIPMKRGFDMTEK